ncbi:hypothetical protein N181_30985 [Sinorhizobium fredii USDA 205]|nr:hypothetical protein [Sinorhizobium fredii]KSV91481.1 hypothetical protein N181_30985 [Sinorhizobium fredii USDA 205]GEC35699.1 hypothetical protein EFR01_58700 [Sinorhizobium fredii]GLS11905.1 hypothetical protein GCM10007864_55370 [Sinorhizobium fredii]
MTDVVDKDRKVLRFAFSGMLLGSAAISFALYYAFQTWRVNNFSHSVGTVTSVADRNVAVRTRGGFDTGRSETITVGTIVFTRSHKGQTYSCEASVTLGVPEDGYQVGDKLDIVPAASTCSRFDVVGRLPRSSL